MSTEAPSEKGSLPGQRRVHRVLIIGNSASLCLDLAAAFDDLGLDVILTCDTSEEAIVSGGATPPVMAVDWTEPAALADQIAQTEPFELAVITPGWFGHGSFLTTTAEDWQAAVTTNFERATLALQAVARHLCAKGQSGRIVGITSVAAMKATPDLSALGTTLAAMQTMYKMAAVELAPYNVTVNVVSVGWIDSGWSASYMGDAVRQDLEQATPLGLSGNLAAVASACCFFAGDDARYITGVILPVDGGYILHRSPMPTTYRK